MAAISRVDRFPSRAISSARLRPRPIRQRPTPAWRLTDPSQSQIEPGLRPVERARNTLICRQDDIRSIIEHKSRWPGQQAPEAAGHLADRPDRGDLRAAASADALIATRTAGRVRGPRPTRLRRARGVRRPSPVADASVAGKGVARLADLGVKAEVADQAAGATEAADVADRGHPQAGVESPVCDGTSAAAREDRRVSAVVAGQRVRWVEQRQATVSRRRQPCKAVL